MTTLLDSGARELQHVGVRHVLALQPIAWLSAAWDDLRHIGMTSIAHGVLLALTGGVLLILGSSHAYFAVAAVSGFLLVGPIVATGPCELSRRRAAREPLGFDESLQPIARESRALFQFGSILALTVIVWFVMSEAMLESVLHVSRPTVAQTLWGDFLNVSSRAQVLAYVGSGAVLAAIIFSISVVTVPLIIDRKMSAVDAMWVSVRATFSNLPCMLVWSGLIVVLTAFGFLTLLVGMIVVAPLLGHATWHAYRDLVVDKT